jgi:RNA binding exosome subunit
MPDVPIHYVDLRTFAYATEDEKRVEDALRYFLPEDQEIEREESTGYHGDRIVVLSTRLKRADEVRYVFEQIADTVDFGTLREELDDRVTEHTELFFRLDKQAAFGGRAELGEGITFRAKIEAYPATREAALENADDVLVRYADGTTEQ